ncbi:MAG: hypothetical protein L0Z70_08430 [Chloroflexi bacterium]|nr:hypothetical protein [Chloroflexota bacterium]
MSQRKEYLYRLAAVILTIALLVAVLGDQASGQAMTAAIPADVADPVRVGGATNYGDERDADVYPAVAYSPYMGRYLVVWLSARAGSSSSLDVYGRFLDRNGLPIGSEFRITDSASAARNSPPTVAAGRDGFVVAWGRHSTYCQVYAQLVTDAFYRADQALVTGTAHNHSPEIVYNAQRDSFVIAYSEGEDYLPPKLFGANVSDCGNASASVSRIRAAEFFLYQGWLYAGISSIVSDVSAGAFRPRIVYSTSLDKYLAVWEDRRNAAGGQYRFDVFAQRLNASLANEGADIILDSGSEYSNEDDSASWTPRPSVASGKGQFLATWFDKRVESDVNIWSLLGSRVQSNGAISAVPVTLAEMSFASSHTGQAPAGFTAAGSLWTADEFLVAFTSHLESLWGYLSLALVQRVTPEGNLVDMDGNLMASYGVGASVDYDNDDQLSIDIAARPIGGSKTADYLVVYSKHNSESHSQDFDIWSVRIDMTTPAIREVYLPLVNR